MKRLCGVRTEVADDRLKEMRAKNAKRQDIYFRPSHTTHPTGEVPNGSCVAYPYFVLDDVEVEVSKEIARRHRCFLVSTSIEGGCQVWIVCNRAIDTITRHKIQSHFASRGICDKGATSGSQYFRFPHFKNHKRRGQWVNLIHTPKKSDVKFDVDKFLAKMGADKKEKKPTESQTVIQVVMRLPKMTIPNLDRFTNPSEADWHEVMSRLRMGEEPEDIIVDLQEKSIERGKHRTYARRTVEKAARFIKS